MVLVLGVKIPSLEFKNGALGLDRVHYNSSYTLNAKPQTLNPKSDYRIEGLRGLRDEAFPAKGFKSQVCLGFQDRLCGGGGGGRWRQWLPSQ